MRFSPAEAVQLSTAVDIAALDPGKGNTKLELIESFQTILGREDLSLIVIDVPIGLLHAGERECDRAARKLIGKRRSSVFPAPIRAMLDAETYEEACQKRYRVEKNKVFGSVVLYLACNSRRG